MSHEHKHDHAHDHGHDHSHGHDHHHHDHDHHPSDHHHHWESEGYVESWMTRDAARGAERGPIIERLIAAVQRPRDQALAVLDVGGGAGVLTEAVLKAYPRAHVTLQDFSQPMLDHGRKRLAAFGERVRYVLADLRDPAWPTLAGGPFDVAVSAIAIHNLHEMAAIAACYEAVRGLLKPGGVFVDYDHFDRVGGVPLHQHMLKVAGFAAAEPVWHEHPTAVVKASI